MTHEDIAKLGLELGKLPMNIKELAIHAHKTAKDKGFWDGKVNVGEKLMLITSELGEAMEAHRKGKFASTDKFISEEEKQGNRLEEFNDEKRRLINQQDYEAVARLRDKEREMLTEKTKARFEEHIKDSFEDEIADAAIRILDLAEGLNINLEFHIRQKMKYNETRERLHGKKY